MALFENHAGISITNNKLQLVEVVYKEADFYLENVDEEYFSEFLSFDDKETKIISILQHAFNELILRKPLQSNFVSLALPNDMFKVIEIPFDESLISEDLMDHFKWELSILYPGILPQDFIIQHIEVNRENDHKRAIVIAVVKKYLVTIHKFCARNNLKLKFADNAHIASNAVLSLDKNFSSTNNVLSLFITDKNFSLILMRDKHPIYFKVKEIDSASELKSKILLEIDRLRKVNISIHNIKEAYVAGENISDSLISWAKDSLNMELIKFNPLKLVKADSTLYTSEVYMNSYNSFSAATGIALRLI